MFRTNVLVFLSFYAVGTFAHEAEDGDLHEDEIVPSICRAATKTQIATVNRGNAKKDLFLKSCARETGGSPWCEQIIRPNPESKGIFECTYGATQVHQLIHPNEDTWKNAFKAVRLVQELEQKGFRMALIYNWWRPEPYNRNVGGSPKRHPLGTSVDIRFATKDDQDRGYVELCKLRKEGRLRALGYYQTTAVHLGVGDSKANTWGKSCP